MFKKLTLLAMSVGALVAFAVPAMAQAEPLVTTEGTYVFATSENTVSTTTAGRLECKTVVLKIDLTENTTGTATGHIDPAGSFAEGNPKTGTHVGPCIDPDIPPAGVPVTITEITGHLHLESGKGSANFAFTFDVLGLECNLSGSGAALTWTPGSTSIHLSGGLGGGVSPCPTAGTISGDFDLTDEEGNPVEID